VPNPPDSQIVINPHLHARMAVDPIKDLQPVASLVNTQLLLEANAPVRDGACFRIDVQTLPGYVSKMGSDEY